MRDQVLPSVFLYPAFFHVIIAIRVIGSDTTVVAGGTANLMCKIETTEKLTLMTWLRRTRGSSKDIIFFVITPNDGPESVNGLGERLRYIGSVADLNASFQLQDVSLEDEGTYTCSCTVYPSGLYETKMSLTVQVPPVVRVAVDEVLLAGELESTIAVCTAAVGKPPAEISWLTDNLEGPIHTFINSSLHSNGTTTVQSLLRASPSRSMNRQEVRCVAKHPALQQEKIVPCKLDIHYPPQSVNISHSGKSHQDPVFHCATDANPAATYTWSRYAVVLGLCSYPASLTAVITSQLDVGISPLLIIDPQPVERQPCLFFRRSDQKMPGDVIRVDGNRLEFLDQTADVNVLYVCEATNQCQMRKRKLMGKMKRKRLPSEKQHWTGTTVISTECTIQFNAVCSLEYVFWLTILLIINHKVLCAESKHRNQVLRPSGSFHANSANFLNGH
ncbi:hypothetical protein JZ751_007711 [Albula glossodonta]|uniref:Ig-like domain-containing protein n=1 Tax=Albula glossodonta TaxID=121402 RepID=A0A8T2MM77_9TELE|nr:hypothetical protein JZ751_007711 [Albula glossodonta]